MDTFCRLPNDVIDIMKEFNQLPVIDVFHYKGHIFKLTIKFKYAFYEVELLAPLVNVEGIDKLDGDIIDLVEFIHKLKLKETYLYIRDYTRHGTYHKMSIHYNDDIIIKSLLTKITLPKECLDLFIVIMEKYYNMLQAHPKI